MQDHHWRVRGSDVTYGTRRLHFVGACLNRATNQPRLWRTCVVVTARPVAFSIVMKLVGDRMRRPLALCWKARLCRRSLPSPARRLSMPTWPKSTPESCRRRWRCHWDRSCTWLHWPATSGTCSYGPGRRDRHCHAARYRTYEMWSNACRMSHALRVISRKSAITSARPGVAWGIGESCSWCYISSMTRSPARRAIR